MANFSLEIGGALSTAWEYAKKYGLLIAVVYLLVGILTNGLQSIGGPSFQDSQAIGEAIGRGDWESVGSIAIRIVARVPADSDIEGAGRKAEVAGRYGRKRIGPEGSQDHTQAFRTQPLNALIQSA